MTHRERFYRALAELSTTEVAEFVATLYRGRGSDARIEGTGEGTVVVVDGDRRFAVHAPGRWRARLVSLPGRRSPPETDDVDGVVTTVAAPSWSERSPTPVVDATTLYDRTLYGVPRATRRRLLDRLGLDARSGSGARSDADEDPTRPGRPGRGIRLLAGAIGVFLIVAGVGTSVGAWAWLGVGAPSAVPGSEAPLPPVGDATPTPFVPTPVTTATPAPADAFPPGVAGSGVVDAERLAEAHRRSLRGRPYRLFITYREVPRSGLVGFLGQTVEVAGPDRYVLRRSVSAEVNLGVTDLIDTPRAYADGERRYVLVPGSAARTYRSRPTDARGTDRYARLIAGYLEEILAGNRTRLLKTFVRNGTRLFRVRVDGGTAANKEDIVATATVDADGTVRELKRWYEFGDVSISITLRYEFGPVTVEPPEWYREGTEVDPENGTGTGNATAR